ncbi:MAG: sulfatase [Verrucomicrobiae bacterium]|nr:sulfatase [Verrucomicrobiae bacterium]
MKRLLLICCLVLLEAAIAHAADNKRPNVLFIAIDDLRDWVHYLGVNQQVKTPNIDRLAARGLAFTRAYCAAPLCNPSRAALLSGLRPSVTGIYNNNVDWRKVIPADATTLPLHFKDQGYYVAGAGKIYHGSFPRPSDWHDYFSGDSSEEDDRRGRQRGQFTHVAPDASNIIIGPIAGDDNTMPDYHFVSYIIRKLNEQRDQPFFLACGLKKPHLPWTVPKKYYELYPLDSIILPKILETDLDDVPPIGQRFAKRKEHDAIVRDGQWKACVQAYLATISFCDAMVGRLLDALDKTTHANNTIICLWSDHGWHLGEKLHWHKSTLWEEATRAPHIWVVPGLTKPGTRCDRPVDYMNIYPTLTDLCGLPTPKHVQGVSLRALLANPSAPWDRPAITTHGQNNHTARSERWRYIRYADGGEELYDHQTDPLEWHNLANDPRFASVKTELAKWLPKENAPIGPQVPNRKKTKRQRQPQ